MSKVDTDSDSSSDDEINFQELNDDIERHLENIWNDVFVPYIENSNSIFFFEYMINTLYSIFYK